MSGTVTVLRVQQALVGHGFNPGPLDGLHGRLTTTATKAFQAARGLPPTGIIDAATATALLGLVPEPADLDDLMPWLDQASRMKGLHERVHNAALSTFLASDGGTVGDPAVHPWCADFVQTCVALSLPDEPVPTNPYASISWLRFGVEVAIRRGAIVCLWRDSPDSWKGHLGFCLEVQPDTMLVLGGNQGDRISEKWIDRAALRPHGSRWPLTAQRLVEDAHGQIAT